MAAPRKSHLKWTRGAGRFYFLETGDGVMFFCLSSRVRKWQTSCPAILGEIDFVLIVEFVISKVMILYSVCIPAQSDP